MMNRNSNKTNLLEKSVSTNEKRKALKEKRIRHNRWMAGIILALILVLISMVVGHVLEKDEKAFAQKPTESRSFDKKKDVKQDIKKSKKEKDVVKAEDKQVFKKSEAPKAVLKSLEIKKEKKQPVKKEVKKEKKKEATEEPASIYNQKIDMPKEHQEFLYELCKQKGLNYRKTLAVIQHESMFNPNATNATHDYGYFQVNQVNHASLASKLHTENSPFNPYINMKWGTYLLSELYKDYKAQGYQGQGLDDAVWSSYNKGKAGFQKYGHAEEYISKMKASIQKINSAF